VAQDHRLIYARAFTWSAQGYPIAQPQTSFRIGSESKVLTAILIRQLMEDPTTKPKFGDNSKIDHLLALNPPPGMTKTKGFEDITIVDLIKHETAVAKNFANFDLDVVSAFGKSLPARSKLDFAAFMMCQPFAFPSGDYRNTNYLFLGALVQKLTGGTWFNALKSRVLAPLGLTLPTPSGSTLARRRPQEVLGHDWNMDLPSSLMSADQPLVRSGYGDVNLEEVGDAIGGMAFPSCDLVKVLASFSKSSNQHLVKSYGPADVMFLTPATDGRVRWTHNGGLSNTDAQLAIRDDGISWAVTFNAGAPQWEIQPDYDELIDAVKDTLPSHDLFPSVGLTPLA
jgi:CubicO group peptidase (beta-lactamase class C family)